MIETLGRLRIKVKVIQQRTSKKHPVGNTVLHGERIDAFFPKIENKSSMFCLIISICHCIGHLNH
jgi:hypothetical protein